MAEINVTFEMRERTIDSSASPLGSGGRQDVEVLRPIEKGAMPKLVGKRFGADEWVAVCERIQGAAEYIQEIEAGRHQQELQAQKIFANMRDEIAAANTRAAAAERMLQDVQQRATTMVKNLEDKLQAAEDRAREAEDWLVRISEAVKSNLSFP
ncbi:hypothetical protein [Methylobacterium aerolatum]|uniref:KfrA N-terminal DNA-binding domain-containing protein n=1 Tax=Methylobacterium aerolatum TaxID=418708 RepID=A0ABU0HY16_9HYPH|nr:hypothetical protein [Methylobacterium aerolatum]MDQ0447233.1 hypothetical protein [Methylobacterium aerolatum]GJD36901.1 hypothetical protein FMGBMHLM_3825 [Methylobacterium aerolatum]